MIDIRYCKRCKEAFDIGTNWNVCPKCRKEIIEKKEEARKCSLQ